LPTHQASHTIRETIVITTPFCVVPPQVGAGLELAGKSTLPQ
jgi:hypothetical protein